MEPLSKQEFKTIEEIAAYIQVANLVWWYWNGKEMPHEQMVRQNRAPQPGALLG